MKKKLSFILSVFILSYMLTGCFGSAPNSQNTLQPQAVPSATPLVSPQLISDTIVSRPIVTGHYIFWTDDRNKPLSTHGFDLAYGYNLDTNQEFLLTDKLRNNISLASDGKTVVWTESPSQQDPNHEMVKGYDLLTAKQFTIMNADRNFGLTKLAIDNNVLYYRDNKQGHEGLYARQLNNGTEQLISPTGDMPVAADGNLLWSEVTYPGNYHPVTTTLYLRKFNETNKDIVVSQGIGPIDNYQVSGDNIVWNFGAPNPDNHVYIYTISTGQKKAVSTDAGTEAFIKGTTVVWSDVPSNQGKSTPQTVWSLKAINVPDITSISVIDDSTAALHTGGIADNNLLVFTVVGHSTKGEQIELYVSSITKRTGPHFNKADNPQLGAHNGAYCGQVYISGKYFHDCNGVWYAKGVQFILPATGINNNTFADSMYNSVKDLSPTDNRSIDYWLNKAQNLNANLLRMYVALPDNNNNTLTTVPTIIDFIRRADQRNMRVGIVLHNNNIFNGYGSPQTNWINSLIWNLQNTYINNGYGNAPYINDVAYVSAENEANNQCKVITGNKKDCYKTNPAINGGNYVDQVNKWVAFFAAAFRGSRILVTVGLSTEMINPNGNPLDDFYNAGSGTTALVDSVSFLSPHNYQGQASNILSYLRNTALYWGPVLLEEYGYPTDPQSLDSSFREGPAICQTSPSNSSCNPSSPWFINLNIQAIETAQNTDGYAGGVAFTIGDIQGRLCSDQVGDNFNGMYTASGPYCGGTTTPATNQLKYSGYQVQQHNLNYYPPGTTFKTYYFPYYDAVDTNAADWILAANPSSGSANVTISIAGNVLWSGVVPPHSSVAPNFANVRGGPVVVSSENNLSLIVSQRTLNNYNFEETLAINSQALSSHQFLPWYDDRTMTTLLYIANPSSIYVASVTIRIGTNYYSLSVNPNTVGTPEYTNVMTGPVEITSVEATQTNVPLPVVVTARTHNGNPAQFNEVAGIAAGNLSSDNFWPWFDSIYTNNADWLLIGNPTGSTISAHIIIGNQDKGYVNVSPGGTTVQQYPNTRGGPVEIVTTDVNTGLPASVYASQRTLTNGTFEEVPGTSRSSLVSSYWFTWYDSVTTDNGGDWILVANPNPNPQSSINATLTIYGSNGVSIYNQTVSISGGSNYNFQALNIQSGPASIYASGAVVVSQRVLTKNSVGQDDFNEELGLTWP